VQPSAIVSSYTSELDIPETIQCHLLGSKYLPGLEPDCVLTVPLAAALLVEYDCDAHFTLYTSPAEVRLLKYEPLPAPVLFQFVALDLDFDNHKSKPTDLDFANLVRSLHCTDYTPNIVYATRGGARLIYLIEPLADPALFEANYQALLQKVAAPLANSNCPYQVDFQAQDWTRLFRCPRVVRDGVAEYDRQVRQFHTDFLDLLRFKVKQKQASTPTARCGGNQPYRHCDPVILSLLKNLTPDHNRNSTAFRLCCYTLRRYNAQAAALWLDHIRNDVVAAGLPEREFERTLESARITVGNAVQQELTR
jgi:hypothetical protein